MEKSLECCGETDDEEKDERGCVREHNELAEAEAQRAHKQTGRDGGERRVEEKLERVAAEVQGRAERGQYG